MEPVFVQLIKMRGVYTIIPATVGFFALLIHLWAVAISDHRAGSSPIFTTADNWNGASGFCLPLEGHIFDRMSYFKASNVRKAFPKNIGFLSSVQHQNQYGNISFDGAFSSYTIFSHSSSAVCFNHALETTETFSYNYASVNWFTWVDHPGSDSNVVPINFFYYPFEVFSDIVCKRQHVQAKLVEVSAMLFSIGIESPVYLNSSPAVWVDSVMPEVDDTFVILVCSESSMSMRNKFTMRVTGLYWADYGNPFVSYDTESYQYEFGNTRIYAARGFSEIKQVVCLDKPHSKQFSISPLVFVTPSFHDKKISIEELHEPPLTAWVEFANEIGFRACAARTENVVDKNLENGSTVFIDYLVITLEGLYDYKVFEERMKATLWINFWAPVLMSTTESVTNFPLIRELLELATEPHVYNFENIEVFSGADDGSVEWIVTVSRNQDPFSLNATELQEQISNFFSRLVVRDRLNEPVVAAFWNSVSEAVDIESFHPVISVGTVSGCIVNAFKKGDCSVDKCTEERAGGMKKIERDIFYPLDGTGAQCDKLLSTTSRCNASPCSIVLASWYLDSSDIFSLPSIPPWIYKLWLGMLMLGAVLVCISVGLIFRNYVDDKFQLNLSRLRVIEAENGFFGAYEEAARRSTF